MQSISAMEVRFIEVGDAKALSEFYLKNAEHLRRWEPLRAEGYHSIAAWRQRISERDRDTKHGKSASFVGVPVLDSIDNKNEIIGTCSLTNIVKGAFQACHMGYAIAEAYQGRGLMKRICLHAIDYAFNELNLNRVMANYMPHNQRSAALLESLGFVKEGMAKKYLFINGKWEDHVLTSLINPRNGNNE